MNNNIIVTNKDVAEFNAYIKGKLDTPELRFQFNSIEDYEDFMLDHQDKEFSSILIPKSPNIYNKDTKEYMYLESLPQAEWESLINEFGSDGLILDYNTEEDQYQVTKSESFSSNPELSVGTLVEFSDTESRVIEGEIIGIESGVDNEKYAIISPTNDPSIQIKVHCDRVKSLSTNSEVIGIDSLFNDPEKFSKTKVYLEALGVWNTGISDNKTRKVVVTELVGGDNLSISIGEDGRVWLLTLRCSKGKVKDSIFIDTDIITDSEFVDTLDKILASSSTKSFASNPNKLYDLWECRKGDDGITKIKIVLKKVTKDKADSDKAKLNETLKQGKNASNICYKVYINQDKEKTYSLTNDNKEVYGKLVGTLMESRTIAHEYHLKTVVPSDHEALQDYYEEVVDSIDDLTELILEGVEGNLDMQNMVEPQEFYVDYFDQLRSYLQVTKLEFFSQSDESYLASILDDIIGMISKLLYKLKRFNKEVAKSLAEIMNTSTGVKDSTFSTKKLFGNAVRKNIPEEIDDMLLDIAQMTRLITYSDFDKYIHNSNNEKIVTEFYELLLDVDFDESFYTKSSEYKKFMKLFNKKSFSMISKLNKTFSIKSRNFAKNPNYQIKFNNEAQLDRVDELMVNGFTSYPISIPDQLWAKDLEKIGLVSINDGHMNLLVDPKEIEVLDPNDEVVRYMSNKTFAKIDSDKTFRDYAHNIMKNAHGSEYSEEFTDKIVDDLLNDHKGASYGELIGRLTSGLGNK